MCFWGLVGLGDGWWWGGVGRLFVIGVVGLFFEFGFDEGLVFVVEGILGLKCGGLMGMM